MAWYAHGGGNGRPLGVMRIAMADCRGGVFAVFAKISPPVLAAIRGYGGGAVV